VHLSLVEEVVVGGLLLLNSLVLYSLALVEEVVVANTLIVVVAGIGHMCFLTLLTLILVKALE
jgi:hypothetical protein